MTTAPFGDQFPLADDSGFYNSRVSEFISRPVNYILTGYKPGYALQASELNELQEQFYLQQTLSNRCLFNWLTSTGTPKPFWNGCTPYSPSQVGVVNNGTNITITVNSGWYYIIDKSYLSGGSSLNSGLGFWTYIKDSIQLDTPKAAISATPSAPSKFGLIYSIRSINVTEDDTLNDNSNSTNVLMEVPGADRLIIENFSIEKYVSQTLLSDILTITNISGSYTVKYLDGTLITTL